MSQVREQLNNLPPSTGYTNPPDLYVVEPVAQTRRVPPVYLGLMIIAIGLVGFLIYLYRGADAPMPIAPDMTTLQIRDLIQRKDFNKAISLLEQKLQREPNDMPTMINLAYAYKSSGQPNNSEELLKRVITASPNEATTYNNFGRLRASQNRWRDAIGYYKRAVLIRPDYTDALMNLAVAYEATQDWAQARIQYQAFLQHDKKNQNLHFTIRRRLRLLQAFESYARNTKDRS